MGVATKSSAPFVTYAPKLLLLLLLLLALSLSLLSSGLVGSSSPFSGWLLPSL
jgi:hypothetical protein